MDEEEDDFYGNGDNSHTAGQGLAAANGGEHAALKDDQLDEDTKIHDYNESDEEEEEEEDDDDDDDDVWNFPFVRQITY